tara:strand:- start:18807 stop:19019 length:213 start_codon:yes stop_codon:yes gene_type:complete
MIERAPEIVNGVTQNEGDFGWRRDSGFDPKLHLPDTPIISFAFNNRQVGARIHECSEKHIEIADVLSGPF